jgi:subtilisin family serine protease
MAISQGGGRRRADPAAPSLMRSVIARPLHDAIRQELAATARMRSEHPDLAQRYRTVIFLNDAYPEGLPGARAAVRALLKAFAEEESARTGRRRAPPRLNGTIDSTMLLGSLDPDAVDHLLGMNDGEGNPIARIWPSRWDVIIDINLKFRALPDYGGERAGQINLSKAPPAPFEADPRIAAKAAILRYIDEAKRRCGVRDATQRVDSVKTDLSTQYVFARLEGSVLLALVEIDRENGAEWAHMAQRALQEQAARAAEEIGRPLAGATAMPDPQLFRAIFQIWPDFALHNCVHRSVRTVKADAAQNSFSAFGDGITWAVIDSGIDWRHPHFAMHANIDPLSPFHRDFTNAPQPDALKDEKGHGTHVAGIIAGQQILEKPPALAPAAPYEAEWRLHGVEHERDVRSTDDETFATQATRQLAVIAGIAPRCKLVSLKVLDRFGIGKASNVIAAIAHVQLINGHGRDLKIHGVNLSLGHDFDAEWFACGYSPLCVEVNRLVKSGVVVVVAAGNTGYGVLNTAEGDRDCCLGLSINDPGNAELAITVGATHRDSPHMYGVSYFSSKGPTGDGRCKPDLIAPGERIISAAAVGSALAGTFGDRVKFAYCESSGTSMAAPHVSGAVAAFLSIRNEFIGEAEKVKRIFTSTATDLGRERYFQGAGLVDLLRAIQSV